MFLGSRLRFNKLKSDGGVEKEIYQYLLCSMSQKGENTEEAAGIVPTDTGRALTAPEFQGLAEMPAELEWFANIDNPRTRRAYRIDVADFMAFVRACR